MYPEPAMFIGTDWRGANGQRSEPIVNPATEDVLGQMPLADAADVEEAIAAAAKGQDIWSGTHGWERAKVLRKVAERMDARRAELAMTLTLEVGRPLAQSDAEVQGALEQFTWFAGEAERLFGETIPSRHSGTFFVTREPIGVVAAFTAWNFPIVLPARKIAPALAAGCAIILRPSEQTPSTARILVECCLEAGVPPEAIQLVTGNPDDVSSAIMASPVVRKISLTGSTRVGKLLMAQAAETMKRCSMELGGHSPVIVCDDVDAEKVAEVCGQSKFRNAGQVCISPSRFYVHEKVAPAFKRAFVDVAESLNLGDGRDPDVTMGPLTTRRQLDRVESWSSETEASGVTVLTGGRRPSSLNAGYFFEPTVFEDVPDDARIMREEPFGPLAPINTFSDLDDAIAKANDTEYGLAAYAFTRDLGRAHHLSSALRAGTVGINTFTLAQAEVPFGGIDYSGMGREGGTHAIDDYLNVKTSHIIAG
ncbi:NAD-dependent succinate-semialdehyde dehydrogenase [Bauldia sp.]|uniref:NAD-dependent succinate-semialdehyde dehydrogenase n=1 Tax=Bauldia sp. TaxID=2575872 RepID=UPI003BA976CF